MNKQDRDILRTILEHKYVNQRILSEKSGYSLGAVNKSMKTLAHEGYLDEDQQLTEKAKQEYDSCVPKNAIILAAGFGMRMVPINLATPKAFLEVNGEPLIERVIGQLHDAGIYDITVVVGFMKETFDYLIDAYGVELVVNEEYAGKNNLHTLSLAADRIGNTYIIPSDIRCESNPFSGHEMYSWYMVSDAADEDSEVRVNRKGELVKVPERSGGNAMIGLSYISVEDAGTLINSIKEADASGAHDEDFWESALYKGGKMIIPARVVSASDAVEINTYEQLRELDGESNHLKSKELDVIAGVFGVTPDDITDISVLKKGMTNRSFLFSVNDEKYIMRVPGEGSDQLVNRAQEAAVFRAISGRGLCDDPVYINPENGYKIARYLEGVRNCDPYDTGDLDRCMKKLKDFHAMHLEVEHSFDLFGHIEYYEELRGNSPSMYKDYQKTKANVMGLKEIIDGMEKDFCLTHIDAVPDNFLFYDDGNGENLQLTDWEYAGMEDPHVDIAMFAIYAMYDRECVDRLIDIYFEGGCDRAVRAKIYCYVAACGLLWSNWCEYKHNLGVEFGEYSLKQYRYAKDYCRYAKEILADLK